MRTTLKIMVWLKLHGKFVKCESPFTLFPKSLSTLILLPCFNLILHAIYFFLSLFTCWATFLSEFSYKVPFLLSSLSLLSTMNCLSFFHLSPLSSRTLFFVVNIITFLNVPKYFSVSVLPFTLPNSLLEASAVSCFYSSFIIFCLTEFIFNISLFTSLFQLLSRLGGFLKPPSSKC